MKITDVEAIPVAIPLRAPILTCYGALTFYNRTIIRLRDSAGNTGLAETSAWVTPAKVEALRSILVGADPRRTGILTARLDNWNYYAGNELLVSAIEVACLDLAARAAGQRLCDLLGGALRERIPVAQYLFARYETEDHPALLDPDAFLAEARRGVETSGSRVLKYKGGHLSPHEDIEVLRALATIEGATLRIDPQGSWSPTTAANTIRAMKDLPIEFFEDPVWGAAAMAQQRALSGMPFATNMCITSLQHLATATTDPRPADTVLCGIWYWGGMRKLQALDAVAQPLGFSLGMYSSCELGVGVAMSLHMAATMRNLSHAIDFMHSHLDDDIIQGGPFRAMDGELAVPDGPGLGVELDDDKVAEYRELALSERSRDRYVDPTTPDARRPGWFPVQPKW